MTGESKEPALVACHQVIGLAGFGRGQKKIVGGTGRAYNARQRADGLGKFFQFVDQAAGFIELEARPAPAYATWLAARLNMPSSAKT